MSKKVLLTRRCEGETLEEECLLISDIDPCYFLVEGVMVEFEGITDSLMKTGYVIFEDAVGIFGIRPENIIKIEEVN